MGRELPLNPPHYKTRKRFEQHGHARALNWSCFGNQPLLSDERLCGWLLECIEAARVKHRFDLWTWCFMPTHVHLLIWPGDPERRASVSAILKSIKLPFTQRVIAFAKREDEAMLDRMRDAHPNGSVAYRFWQRGGGYDRNLYDAKAIREMMEYIHRNPVEEGLCARSEDWKWSSARAHLSGNDGLMRLDLKSVPGVTG